MFRFLWKSRAITANSGNDPLGWDRKYPLQSLKPRFQNSCSILALCIIVVCLLSEFDYASSPMTITPGTEVLPVEFVNKIKKSCKRRHKRSSGECPNDKNGCGLPTIFSLDCTDGFTTSFVKRHLADCIPSLICASQSFVNSSVSLQAIMENHYDLVLLDGRHNETYLEHLHFWNTMLTQNGSLTVISHLPKEIFIGSAQIENHSTTDIISGFEQIEVDTFVDQIESIFKKLICSPLNKMGIVCGGDILQLDCEEVIGLQLVEGSLLGNVNLVCPESESKWSMEATPRFHKRLRLDILFHRQYEAILLDASKSFPINLELWSQLLAPGGFIAISGRLNNDQKFPIQYLHSLNLESVDNSDNPFLIFASLRKETSVNQTSMDKKHVWAPYKANNGTISSQIQLSPFTMENRYPAMYAQVTRQLLTFSSCKIDDAIDERIDSCPLKVLSFGCSYGFEMKSLADLYLFGKADIYGVDVNDRIIERARENVKGVTSNNMLVLDGKTDHASNYGPFDAVFANSVLCYNVFPQPKDPVATIKKVFPFEVFEQLLTEIDAMVKLGGLLTLYNANYLFNQTKVYAKYETYEKNQAPTCGQDVRLLSSDGNQVIFDPYLNDRQAYTVYCVFVKIRN